ncbi:hypothetical protein B0H14DRAFT_2416449 [Mycena olivaceomarginata]|nr:hypothetical protein B0H14DRAFT_2416449 [Mycena olivaceomarginata]
MTLGPNLFKLPFIVGVTLGLHAASTAPNPPPLAADKRLEPTNLEFMLTSPMFRNFQKAVYWFAAIAEISIIAGELSSYSVVPRSICLALSLGANLDAVRVKPVFFFGSALVASGAILRVFCYRALDKHFTFETSIARDHKLVRTGPYGFVRHPAYSGAFLAYFGLLCYYESPGAWFMECAFKGTSGGKIFGVSYAIIMSLVVAGLLSGMSREDDGLKKEFGKEWSDWAAVVPYALIPVFIRGRKIMRAGA